MRRTRVRAAQVFRILQTLHADSKLVAVVKRLTREVERLDEENAQLYCTVMLYREVLRRRDAETTNASSNPSARDAA